MVEKLYITYNDVSLSWWIPPTEGEMNKNNSNNKIKNNSRMRGD